MDWPNTFDGCRGNKQSPVLLPASGAAAKALGQPDAKSSFSYGTLSSAKITNNGHTLQVSLPADFKSDVKIPIKGEQRHNAHQCSCHVAHQCSVLSLMLWVWHVKCQHSLQYM
jgi:carbonic anhydrase